MILTIDWIVFLITVATTFIVFQIMWDGQFITYRIFEWLHKRDDPAFVDIHGKYVANLGLPTYTPIVIYLLSAAALFFYRPATVGIEYVIVINLLNLLAMISTFVQLVPIHIRIDRDGRATDQQVRLLLRYNTIRFALMALNGGIVIYLLAQLLLS